MKTEKQMREEEVPTFDTVEELTDYITSQVERQHDYGTCVYAMSTAAVAAFKFVARKLSVTGFQASCADLDILRRTRRMDGPFVILKAEDELYPQHDIAAKLAEARASWAEWAATEAQKKIDEHGEQGSVHPNVWNHWQKLAASATKESA